MFTAIAGKYDRLNALLSFGRDRAWRRFVASQAHPGPGDLVLDVATGTGELARHLAERGSRVVGVDFCPAMLARARGKPWAVKIELLLGDALRLPFQDSIFDCITIAFALRNVADIAQTFSELTRVTRPGGRVISLELTRPPSRLVRTCYYGYLLHLAPLIGGLLSGNQAAYRYLPDSILEFPSPQEVKAIMEGAGLEPVHTYRLTLGTATIHEGTKKGRP